MKIFIILISFSLSFVGYGQQSSHSKTVTDWRQLVFLDSVLLTVNSIFDPNKIASIYVVKDYYDSTKQIQGKIFITSKDPKSFNFLTISDLATTYKKDTNTPTIFMLDNEFLKDTTTFKIDSSFILKVEITRTSEIEYLKNTHPDLTILKIITRTKENLDKQNEIRIRGTETTLKR